MAEQSQAESILLLQNKSEKFYESFLSSRENKNPYQWSKKELTDSIKNSRNQILAVVEIEQVKSILIFQSTVPQIEIIYLETQEKDRGRGLMKKLLNHMIEQNPQSPIWLDVHESNEPALALYKKLGFIVNGKRPAYYRNGGTSLVLSRPIVLDMGEPLKKAVAV